MSHIKGKKLDRDINYLMSKASGLVNTYEDLTDAATTVWAFSPKDKFKVWTIEGNHTLDLQNTVDGDMGVLFLIQDETGNRTATLPGFLTSGATLSTAANSVDLLTFTNYGGHIFWELNKYGPVLTTTTTTSTTTTTTTTSGGFDIMSISWLTAHDPGQYNYSDLSQTPTVDGGTIEQLRDIVHYTVSPTTNNYDFIQLTAGDRPKYVASGINGKPVVEVGDASANHKYISTGSFTQVNAPITKVFVIQLKTQFTGSIKYLSKGGQQLDLAKNNNEKLALYSGGAGFTDTTYTISTANPFVVVAQFNGDSTADVWVNGTQVLTAGAVGANTFMTTFELGENTTLCPHAWYGRCFTKVGTLTSTERNNVFTYLQTFYNIP